MHLAGHEDHGDLVIDTHDHPVADAVWALYRGRRGAGSAPCRRSSSGTRQIPPLESVLAEARRAEAIQATIREGGVPCGDRGLSADELRLSSRAFSTT